MSARSLESPLRSSSFDNGRHVQLSRCFWLVVGAHSVLFVVLQGLSRPFSLESRLSFDEIMSPLGIMPFGAIGTLAVWFAWTNRALGERVARSIVAVASTVGAVYLTRDSRFVQHDWMIECSFLLIGALGVSLPASWFGRLTISPPGDRLEPASLSIGDVFALTVCIAAWLAIVRAIIWAKAQSTADPELFLRIVWLDAITFVAIGAVLGTVASLNAWIALRFETRMVMAFVVATTLHVATLSIHSGVLLFLAISASPLFTFIALRQVGYRREPT